MPQLNLVIPKTVSKFRFSNVATPRPLPLLCCHAPAMRASQGTPWLLHLILSPVLLCFLNQRGSHCTKKMLSNRPAKKYTCVVKHAPPILESRELIHWLCSHLAVYFTKFVYEVLFDSPFSRTLQLSPEQWKNGKEEKRKEKWEMNRKRKRKIFILSAKNKRYIVGTLSKNAPRLLSAN